MCVVACSCFDLFDFFLDFGCIWYDEFAGQDRTGYDILLFYYYKIVIFVLKLNLIILYSRLEIVSNSTIHNFSCLSKYYNGNIHTMSYRRVYIYIYSE